MCGLRQSGLKHCVAVLVGLLLLPVAAAQTPDQCIDVFPSGVNQNSNFELTPIVSGGPNIDTGNNFTLNLAGGQEHAYGNVEVRNNFTVNVTGSGTARWHIDGDLDVRNNARINANGNPEDLVIYVYGDVEIGRGAITNALIYVVGEVEIGRNGSTTGAITAGDDIDISGSHNVNYDGGAIGNTDFNGMCDGGSASGPNLVAEYRFDELLWQGNNGEVLDSSGNNRHGRALQTADGVATINNGFICRAGDFPAIDAVASHAVSTPLVPSVDMGNNGAISIWHRRSTAWSTTSHDVVLWDASSNSKYFYLVRLAGGRLLFGMEDEDDGDFRIVTDNAASIAADSWANITVNWDVANGAEQGQIWLNGSKLAVSKGNDTLSPSKDIGDSFELYIGDNRSAYSASPGGGNFQRAASGNIDEVLVYDAPLSSTQLNDIITLQSAGLNLDGSPRSCPFTPVAQYRFEETSWNGSPSEVADLSGNNLNGVARNGANTAISAPLPAIAGDPGTCRFGDFGGNATRHFVEVADNNLLDIPEQLTVSTWIYPRAFPSSGLHTIVSKDTNYEFHLNSSRQINWWWNDSAGRIREFNTSGPQLTPNTWYHLAIVYRDGSQKIYIDGVERGSASFTGRLATNSEPLFIGVDVAFAGSRNFNGAIDEVTIFPTALSQAEVNVVRQRTYPCAAIDTLDHFEIVTGASASTCQPHPVTIRACASSLDCSRPLTNYSGQVSIRTSTNNGNWSKNSATGSLSPAPDNDDNGAVQYTFNGSADNGEVVLDLSNTHAESLTITVDDGSGVADTSAAITFANNAFVITENTTTLVAGRDQPMSVAMWLRDPVAGDCRIASDYQGNRTLKAWLSRDSLDPAGLAPALVPAGGSAVTLPSAAGSNNLTLNFTSGVAGFDFRTSDVGKYALNLRDDTSGYAGVAIDGASASLTARPFGFEISAVGNPAASDASGNAYLAAGDAFTVQARAVLWQAIDDANNDGIPDGHGDNNPANNADLSDNGVTPAFASAVTISSYLVLPSPGVDPGINPVTVAAFSGGVGQVANVRFDEVGIIELTANLAGANYLGSGGPVIGDSSHVGRFTPSYFEVNNKQVVNRIDAATQAACSDGFTFLDEQFALRFTLAAKNASGNTTANYVGDFAYLETLLSVGNGGAGEPNSLNVLARYSGIDYSGADRLSASPMAPSFVAGEAGTPAAPLELPLRFTRLGAGPYTPEQPLVGVEYAINPVDADLVSANGSWPGNYDKIGETTHYFGRVVIDSAYGPENALLPMWASSEYCATVSSGNCSVWQDLSRSANLDRCTVLPVSVPVEVAVEDYWRGGNNFNNSSLSAQFQPFDGLQGRGGGGWRLRYTAGGDGGTYAIPLLGGATLYNYHPYLIIQPGTANFGSFRGHDRVIYWRER